jgi:hypothetical protein
MIELNKKQIHKIKIEPLKSGYVVSVGCATMAIESTDKLRELFNAYLDDPDKFEKEWTGQDQSRGNPYYGLENFMYGRHTPDAPAETE